MPLGVAPVVMELNAVPGQMHAAARGGDPVMMDVRALAVGHEGIAIDILLMVADIIVVNVHARAFSAAQADADMTALNQTQIRP